MKLVNYINEIMHRTVNTLCQQLEVTTRVCVLHTTRIPEHSIFMKNPQGYRE